MIAWAIAVFIKRESKRWRLVITKCDISSIAGNEKWERRHITQRFLNPASPLLRRADAADNQLVIFHPPDHVHVNHRHGAVERQDWILDVKIRAEQAFLFAAKRDEDERAFQVPSLRREDARQFKQPGDAGCVVVRAVMDVACARGETSLAAASQVIVVRADDDDLILQDWIEAV